MATLAEIEAALAANFDREQLAVYGDYLQSIGDPRGELVAIDLHVGKHGRTPELDDRKRELVERWLGDDLAEILRHAGAIDHGFVLLGHRAPDMASHAVTVLLAHPAGEFLRELTVLDTWLRMLAVYELLAAAPRRWLAKLRVPTPLDFDERNALTRACRDALPLLREVVLVGETHEFIEAAFPSHVRVSFSSR
jgi:hypothetical protein